MQNKESKKDLLLRCPFCGGEAKACEYYFIQCTKCGTSTLTHTNREEAINKWNTRKPMQEIIERLKEEKANLKEDWLKYDNEDDYGGYFATSRAIEIVKKVGGMNDEMEQSK